MALLVHKPLLAASIAISSLALLGFLWQKHRQDCRDDYSPKPSLGDIDPDQINKKLEHLQRQKLDNIEEEICCEAKSDFESNFSRVAGQSDSKSVDSPVLVSNCNSEGGKMTEKDAVESSVTECAVSGSGVTDKDSVFLETPSTGESSPSKSEPEISLKSSTESWSDLIERDEEELLTKLSDVARGEAVFEGDRTRQDSGVASPSNDLLTREVTTDKKVDTSCRGEDAGLGGSEIDNVSDSGQGSDVYCEDSQLLAYHFHLPDYLSGKLIGARGEYIKKLKSDTSCNVVLRELSDGKLQKRNRQRTRDRRYAGANLNICIIEGTRSNIDKCLDIIRNRFSDDPDLTLEQINKPDNNSVSLVNGSVNLSLVEGIMQDVLLSSIVTGGHMFLQQPGHPTFTALDRLNSCMHNTYTQLTCPELSQPVAANTICVAFSEGSWYRVQVIGYCGSTETCEVKFVDYGGYDTVPVSELRQIRTDFLSLPFQAIECKLANVLPVDPYASATVLQELAFGQALQARMIGCDESGVPMIHLYRSDNGQTVMINRELVDRGAAQWIEATIVPLVQQSGQAQF